MPKDSEKGPWTSEAATTMQTKDYSKYFDPCQEAAEQTYRCLRRNDGARDFCKDYFDIQRMQEAMGIKVEKHENGRLDMPEYPMMDAGSCNKFSSLMNVM